MVDLMICGLTDILDLAETCLDFRPLRSIFQFLILRFLDCVVNRRICDE